MISVYNTITILILVSWFFLMLFDYAEMCYVWQLKSYRWDRIRDFFSTKQGKYFFRKMRIFWRCLWLFVLLVVPVEIQIILLILFIIQELAVYAIRLFKGKWKRPALSYKVLIIIISTATVEFALLFFLNFKYEFLMIFTIIRFLILSLVISLYYLADSLLLLLYRELARRKLEKYEKLTVIGITGSYGKTTVKEFLYQILSNEFKVIKTPKNYNTTISIAKFILKNDFSDYDIFIVEIGAYKIYDVKFTTKMLNPKIGILTAINEQHLSLFGSIEKIQNAKYDLLRMLPKDGLAVTNIDNKYCREKLSEISCEVKTFGIIEEYNPDALVKDIKEVDNGLIISGRVNGVEGTFFAPVVGKHNASNIVACILVAMHLGMKKDKIIESIGKLKMPRGTMQIFNYGNSTVIDDSYNSNPDGFKSALDAMKVYPSERKRIVITRGILELGEKSAEIHEKIGNEIAFVVDELVLVSKDYEEFLKKGVGKKYNTDVIIKDEENDLMNYVKNLKNKNAVILVENRIPHKVYQELTGYNN
ncbi:MAG: hypothetical protein GF349_04580 [Candidatus Magasanikbacteria bacterium]|nr:hypothetical protein [Candidatus Magasanikbacteria bacterium]